MKQKAQIDPGSAVPVGTKPGNADVPVGSTPTAGSADVPVGSTLTAGNADVLVGSTLTAGSADVLVGTTLTAGNAHVLVGTTLTAGNAHVPVGSTLTAGNADVPVGSTLTAGNADVPVGSTLTAGSADVLVGSTLTAGNADVLVGSTLTAGEDAGAPRDDAPRGGAPRNWYSRGYLPHLDSPSLYQSITYRLDDSLPQEKLQQLDHELRRLPEAHRESAKRRKIEQWLDAGMGCCALRHSEVARYVQNSFLHFHGERYHLHAWCVMPNHVHVLVEPLTDLALIVQGWKSFTSRWVLRNSGALGLQVPPSGKLWMREYWDRYIRDENHYRKVVDYIHQNPVSAGLCANPEAWPWSSAGSGVPGSAVPGSAGVPAGNALRADEDVGAPNKRTDR